MPFLQPLQETASKMQIKCRLLEWLNILICFPPPAYYNFYFCNFFLPGCNKKQKSCGAARIADCVGSGSLTEVGNISLAYIFKLEKIVCLGKISLNLCAYPT